MGKRGRRGGNKKRGRRGPLPDISGDEVMVFMVKGPLGSVVVFGSEGDAEAYATKLRRRGTWTRLPNISAKTWVRDDGLSVELSYPHPHGLTEKHTAVSADDVLEGMHAKWHYRRLTGGWEVECGIYKVAHESREGAVRTIHRLLTEDLGQDLAVELLRDFDAALHSLELIRPGEPMPETDMAFSEAVQKILDSLGS